MSADLRALLIDCRIALRRLPAGDSTLAAQLEGAIREIDRGQGGNASSAHETASKSSAQQVALAWQTACRGLMLSHPALYTELRNKVMSLLDVRVLTDPDAELLRLEQALGKAEAERAPLQARLDEWRQRASDAQATLAGLRDALAAAAADMPPAAAEAPDPLALARAQIAWLQQQRGQGTPAAAAAAAPVAEGPVPSRAVLRAVLAGERGFSKDQRDWVVGEALGLTAWQYTPVELLQKGDAWLAERILESPGAPP